MQTNDVSLHGDHQVVLAAYIGVPSDFTQTIINQKKAEHTFTVTLVDTCKTAQLDDLVIEEMRTSVLGESVLTTFENVQDSASREGGDVSGLEFCGPRSYSLK